MIKLTISHAISQSVKLALYECQMDDTIDDTKIIPIRLAQTGKLNYSRPQITRISGHLFQLRMNVDLVSNVLGRLNTNTHILFKQRGPYGRGGGSRE